jgi:hypothetical protein
MLRFNQEEGRYRVLLIGIGDSTEEEKESFSHNVSKNYNIPFPLLKKIVDRCPIILKKNLSFKKAQILAKTLKSFGATVSVEEKRNFPPISLEFQELVPHQLALESSYLRKTQRGTWNVLGRAENISDESLNDIWVLIQLFDALEEFIAFEETPFPINPLPSGEASPFKVVFEGSLSIKKISVAFKNASGQPIPAVDKRKKREWVEVEIEDEDGRFFSSPRGPTEFEDRSQTIDQTEPSSKMIVEKEMEIVREIPLPSEQEAGPFPIEDIREEEGGEAEEISEQPLPLTLESSEEVSESYPELLEEDGHRGDEELGGVFGYETFQKLTSSISEELEEEREGAALGELELRSDNEEVAEESRLDASVFEEATQLLEDISESPGEVELEERTEGGEEEVAEGGLTKEESIKEEEVEKEVTPSFPWIEYFRDVVKTFYQKPHDIFSIWFEKCRKEGEFNNSFHTLLTILVHSRFDQGSQSFKALENTQRVFKLLLQPNLLLDEIPPLEGTPFVSGEAWRNLFHRALLKIQQIGNAILEKNKWDAFDLERLIQVIPHMGYQNSRMAIRWINELIPDIVEVDFSDTPIPLGEGLYRVASRLGILDPHFDYYQGRNSMGEIKIQSFAKTAFPENPLKVEEPMAWMGRREEEGGHCFPIHPWCGGCLFETFCPRLYIDFNPSEKGMKE